VLQEDLKEKSRQDGAYGEGEEPECLSWGWIRERVYNLLKGGIRGEEKEKGAPFLSGQVASDMMEVWVVKFDPNTVVPAGFGGLSGLDIWVSEGQSGTAEGGQKAPKRQKMTKDLRVLLNEVVELLQDDDELMACLGLFKDGDGLIKLVLNRRLLCVVDVEHFSCKIYISAIRKSASRLSNKPIIQYNATHPSKKRDDFEDIGWYQEGLGEIFSWMLKSFKERGRPAPPKFQSSREQAAKRG